MQQQTQYDKPSKRGVLTAYLKLMRVDRPIGIFLLLWPTLGALWIASGGFPRLDLLLIFSFGTAVMRSAGLLHKRFCRCKNRRQRGAHASAAPSDR
jgi:4-hydroxybenzoate polyprenyltransferase